MENRRNRITQGLSVTIGVFVLVLVLARLGILTPLEQMTLDWRYIHRGAQQKRVPIVIVEIDQDSLDSFTEPLIFWGRHHAKVIHTLHNLGAKVIGFDALQNISLAEYTDRNPDQDFAEALATVPGMVLTCKRRTKAGKVYDMLPTDQLLTALRLGNGELGFDNTGPDEDQVLRSQQLADADRMPSFALAVAEMYLGAKAELGKSKDRIDLGRDSLRTDADWRLPIDFIGPNFSFPRVSYKQLLTNPNKSRGILKDSIALIGFTSIDMQDYHTVPFTRGASTGGLMPGIEVHGNTVHTLLTGARLHRAKPSIAWVLVGVLVVLSTVISVFCSPLVASLAFLLLAGGWSLIVFMLFTHAGLIMPMMIGETAVGLDFLVLGALRYREERRSRRYVVNLFGRYVSRQVVSHLLQNPEALELGGKRQPVTIVFSDIRGFTTLSEELPPEKVTAVLNEYFTEMEDIIFRNEGTIDKYIGDAIMAIFNWPVEQADHARRAVKTALEMHQRVVDRKERWKQYGLDNFAIGVGVNSGPAILGNVGSPRRMEQTAIGDTVNVASRLESLNKQFGTHVLVSSGTLDLVKDLFESRLVSELQVKGRAKPVTVYEVLGEKMDTRAEGRDES